MLLISFLIFKQLTTDSVSSQKTGSCLKLLHLQIWVIEERNTIVSVFQNLTLPVVLRTKTPAAKVPELLCKDRTN